MPSGANNLPSIPPSANNGMKTRTTIIVPNTIERRTSVLARNTTSSGFNGLPAMRFSLSRLKIFSTSTMASSTNSPMATAMPPSVIVLIESPNTANTIAVMTSESGMAVSVMNVVLKFIKNRNRMITTKMPPSRNASTTFSIARSINVFCE